MFFTNPYAETKRAIDLTFDDTFEIFEDAYRKTAYQIIRPGTIKLSVVPVELEGYSNELAAHNPITSIEVSTEAPVTLTK